MAFTQVNRNGLKLLADRSCTRYKEKLTKEEAELKATVMANLDGYRWNSYHCPKCEVYHIGHKFPRERI